MKLSNFQKRFENSLERYTSSIVYAYFNDEVDYLKAPIPTNLYKDTFVLPRDRNSNPLKCAAVCKKRYKNTIPCILIPGRRFDTYGTRYGRGAGWYDRFLSEVPDNWLRIGITDKSNMFFGHLKKQSWDESMDWVLVFDSVTLSWGIYENISRLK